ncbi:MAG: RND transporter [Alphaproteobacteria bacterium PA2]|nr:MAG: RND transporter [Alphaproteobacteria bacterium PA2]
MRRATGSRSSSACLSGSNLTLRLPPWLVAADFQPRSRSTCATLRTPGRPMVLRARLLTTALVLSLGGCATVGPDHAPPAAPVATTYPMQGDARATSLTLSPNARQAGAWWTPLGSPALDEVMRLALKDNPTIEEANAVLARAQAQTAAAQGALSPQASLEASPKRERINTQSFGFVGFPSPTLNLYSIGGTVSYDLDLFGGRRRALEGARARAEAEAYRAEAAYLALTGNIAVQALKIAYLHAQRDALDAVIRDDHQTIDMLQKSEAAGGSGSAATASGYGLLARDQGMRPALTREIDAARHQLAYLVGKSPAEWSPPDFKVSDFTLPKAVPVALPSSLVRQRPDILAADAELHAATAQIGVATADLFPDIKLTARLTQGSVEPESLFSYDSTGWELIAGLTAPVLNGGRLKAAKTAAVANARAAEARYRSTVLRALLQVADSMSALGQDDLSLEAAHLFELVAQENLKDAEAAYRLGGGPRIDVANARKEVNRARRSTLEVESRRAANLIDLMTATSGRWSPDKPAS